MSLFESYEKSEILQKISSLMSEISSRYEYFNKIYQDKYRGNLTEEGMLNKIRGKLNTFSDMELDEYNEMHKMFSQTNCEWSLYHVGEIVHKEILKIWYPEKVK